MSQIKTFSHVAVGATSSFFCAEWISKPENQMLNSILFTSLWMPRLGDIALTIVKYCLRATRHSNLFSSSCLRLWFLVCLVAFVWKTMTNNITNKRQRNYFGISNVCLPRNLLLGGWGGRMGTVSIRGKGLRGYATPPAADPRECCLGRRAGGWTLDRVYI